NHDLNYWSGYRAAFAPLADQKYGDVMRYSFDWGPAHFTSISSPLAAAGAPGLADELAAAHNLPWRFVFLHEPLYTAGRKRVVPHLRTTLGPILEAGGVDVVLAGHEHYYERSLPSCEYVPSAHVLHIISGGGSDVQLDTVRPHPNFPRALAVAHFLRGRVAPGGIDGRVGTPAGHTFGHFPRLRAPPAGRAAPRRPPLH